ncbi:MAG: recombinase family protein [Syntrophobacterales bacterium]|nr:MAG: recombinase family protein [Syntrophobacterales bacterium]
MNKQKKAIGYVCDVPVTGTNMIIGKEDQRARLLKYAKKENIELVNIFEDDAYTRDFMNRPGVQKVLTMLEQYDTVLVERAWVLTRERKDLVPFLEKIEPKQIKLVATTYLWDYLHQELRRRYRNTTARKPAGVTENTRHSILEMKPRKTNRIVYTQGATMA